MLLHLLNGRFLEPGHLRLRNADFVGDFHLRFAFEEAHRQNHFLAFVQFVHRFPEGDFLDPGDVLVVLATQEQFQSLDRMLTPV